MAACNTLHFHQLSSLSLNYPKSFNKNRKNIGRKNTSFFARYSNGQYNSFPGKAEADVVVIGSGIGGLSCAGLLARYGEDVIVLESHDRPGGAAHSFQIKGYKFESGPSVFSGFQSRGPKANPLAQVLDALGETFPYATYDSWMTYTPEGEFLTHFGSKFFKVENPGPPKPVKLFKQIL